MGNDKLHSVASRLVALAAAVLTMGSPSPVMAASPADAQPDHRAASAPLPDGARLPVGSVRAQGKWSDGASPLAQRPKSKRAAGPTSMTLTELTWGSAHVDARAGVTNRLTWTVQNTASGAGFNNGFVSIQLQGPKPGQYIGPEQVIEFWPSSAEESNRWTWSYDWFVPQYAPKTAATWVVTRFAAYDDAGRELLLSGARLSSFTARSFKATELVDVKAPTFRDVQLLPWAEPYGFIRNQSAEAGYELRVHDPDGGFWKGSVLATGPGGRTLTGTFVRQDEHGSANCGTYGASEPREETLCSTGVTIPANTAAGTWTIKKISLTDLLGSTKVYTGLSLAHFRVTSNATLHAGGFAVAPKVVNNWHQPQDVVLQMQVWGAKSNVRQVAVTMNDSGCVSRTPAIGNDGRVTVPITMLPRTKSCNPAGIAIEDGAGNLALYGPKYHAPDPDVSAKQLPNTTPPSATTVKLSRTSAPASEFEQYFTVTADVYSPVAGVNGYDLYVYDEAGEQVTSSVGGTAPDQNGQIHMSFYLAGGTPPGAYTIGFRISDAGGLLTSYGPPNGEPMPGGPLRLTVTAAA